MKEPISISVLVETADWIPGLIAALGEHGISPERLRGTTLPVLEADGVKVTFGLSNFGPGIAVSLEEARSRHAATWAFRLGTCGGYEDTMEVGNIVLCTGAIRGEGTSSCYIEDPRYPAVADLDATLLLMNELASAGTSVYSGIVWTTDGRIAGQYDPQRIAAHKRSGVLGVEMETSAMFVVARTLGIRAASVAVVVDLPAQDRTFSPIDECRIEAIDHGLRQSMYAIARSIVALRRGHSSVLPGPHVRHETQSWPLPDAVLPPCGT